jgi:hypothetical protein
MHYGFASPSFGTSRIHFIVWAMFFTITRNDFSLQQEKENLRGAEVIIGGKQTSLNLPDVSGV